MSDLSELFAKANGLLLDFDGPICAVFANHAASEVAAKLVSLVEGAGWSPSNEICAETDPLEVLKWSTTLGCTELVEEVDHLLGVEELAAVATARATPHIREVVTAANIVGLRMAVVSNNSSGAISKYLQREDLTQYIGEVCGRTYGRPDLMKPNPKCILTALTGLGLRAEECVLVGDSLADIIAGQRVDVPVIGLANRPGKATAFAKAGAIAVVTELGPIVKALVARL